MSHNFGPKLTPSVMLKWVFYLHLQSVTKVHNPLLPTCVTSFMNGPLLYFFRGDSKASGRVWSWWSKHSSITQVKIKKILHRRLEGKRNFKGVKNIWVLGQRPKKQHKPHLKGPLKDTKKQILKSKDASAPFANLWESPWSHLVK